MSRRIQIGFFAVLAIVVSIILFRSCRPEPAPKVLAPILNGDEMYPGDRLYSDGRVSLKGDPILTRKAVLYLYVYRRGETGKPLAARRIKNPSFPIRLFMRSTDAVGGQAFYEGDITVTGLLSISGEEESRSENFEGAVEIDPAVRRGELILKAPTPVS